MTLRVLTASVLLALNLTTMSFAQAAMKRSVDIPAQPLGAALEMLAKQTGIQLIYSTELAEGRTSAHLEGSLTAAEGLKQLLAPTALKFEFIDSDTVMLFAERSHSGTARAESSSFDTRQGQKVSDLMRLAQANKPVPATDASLEPASQKSPVQLTEVVVSAQKREQNVLDVPISIAVVSGNELQQRRITSLEDLTYAVPDLYLAKGGAFYNYEIRGVANVTGTGPLIGLYLDEADITLPLGTQINPVTYDLERVEVLRGPQGTLYGDGAAGGTIRFITKSPNLDKFAFNADVAALFTPGGDPGHHVDAVVNVPLIEDQLGFRIVGNFDHDGGWLDQPAADSRHINGQSLTNIRVKGLWQPDTRFSVSSLIIVNRNERGLDFSDNDSSHTYTQLYGLTSTPTVSSDYNLYSLTASYDVGSVAKILNTTSYLSAFNVQRFIRQTFPVQAPGLPLFTFVAGNQNFADSVLTNELRFSSLDSSPWQWTLGGFFRRATEEFNDSGDIYGLAIPPGAPLPSPTPLYTNNYATKEWSAFGDTSYLLWNRFTLGAGVRYFEDEQTSWEPFQTGNFHSIDPRFYMQFKLTQEANIYASAAKGFRSGGFNGPERPSYGPESVWTYELGSKTVLLDGEITFDTSIFLSNYSNYVVFGTDPTSTLTIKSNEGYVRIKGIESSLTWRPSSQWTLEAHGNSVNGRFTSIAAQNTPYIVGDPVDLVPRYQLTLSGQYNFSWLNRPSSARLDYSQQGPLSYRNRYVNGPSGGPSPWFHNNSDVVRLVGFHSNLQWNENLRFGFFVQNLLNNQTFLNPYSYLDEGLRPRPRTFGIEFGVTFD